MLDRVKRIWYLSPMRAANVQAGLRISAVSPEPPLLAHTSSESIGPSNRKPDPWPLCMAGHAQLKFFMTECSKTQIRLTGPMLRTVTMQGFTLVDIIAAEPRDKMLEST